MAGVGERRARGRAIQLKWTAMKPVAEAGEEVAVSALEGYVKQATGQQDSMGGVGVGT
jgi:hypothetical protein